MKIDYDRGRFSVDVWGYDSDETRELSMAALRVLLARAAAEPPPAPVNITQIQGDVIASAIGTGAAVTVRDVSVEKEEDRGGSVRLKDLGLMLREKRLRRNLTQRDLAQRLGISTGFLSRIEAGERAVTFSMLEKLIDALR